MNTIKRTHTFTNGQRLEIVHGDITTETVDAIVNAANERLAHGGGVAGVISRKGGPDIQRESDAWVREHGPIPHEKPAYTGAGRLPCRYVIHAVGPVWGTGGEQAKLASAVRAALDLADEYGLNSVSMPGISSGIFGFPKPLCAQVMLGTISAWLAGHPESSVRVVNTCNIDDETAQIFLAEAHGRWNHRTTDRG